MQWWTFIWITDSVSEKSGIKINLYYVSLKEFLMHYCLVINSESCSLLFTLSSRVMKFDYSNSSFDIWVKKYSPNILMSFDLPLCIFAVYLIMCSFIVSYSNLSTNIAPGTLQRFSLISKRKTKSPPVRASKPKHSRIPSHKFFNRIYRKLPAKKPQVIVLL